MARFAAALNAEFTTKYLARQSRNQSGFRTGMLTAKGAMNAKKTGISRAKLAKTSKLRDQISLGLGGLCVFGVLGARNIRVSVTYGRLKVCASRENFQL